MKTSNIIITAIIGIVFAFFTGAYVGTHFERVHHENDKANIKTLEETNKEKEAKLEELGPAKMGNLDSLTDEQVELFAKELERGNKSVIDLLIARDMIKKHK